ncbi:unnamed protein product [Prunus armeniaca]
MEMDHVGCPLDCHVGFGMGTPCKPCKKKKIFLVNWSIGQLPNWNFFKVKESGQLPFILLNGTSQIGILSHGGMHLGAEGLEQISAPFSMQRDSRESHSKRGYRTELLTWAAVRSFQTTDKGASP